MSVLVIRNLDKFIYLDTKKKRQSVYISVFKAAFSSGLAGSDCQQAQLMSKKRRWNTIEIILKSRFPSGNKTKTNNFAAYTFLEALLGGKKMYDTGTFFIHCQNY